MRGFLGAIAGMIVVMVAAAWFVASSPVSPDLTPDQRCRLGLGADFRDDGALNNFNSGYCKSVTFPISPTDIAKWTGEAGDAYTLCQAHADTKHARELYWEYGFEDCGAP